MQLVNGDFNFNSHSLTSSNSVILGSKNVLPPLKLKTNFPLFSTSWVRSPFPSLPFASPECRHLSCKQQIAFVCIRVIMAQYIKTLHSVSDFSFAMCPGALYHARPLGHLGLLLPEHALMKSVCSCLPHSLFSEVILPFACYSHIPAPTALYNK